MTIKLAISSICSALAPDGSVGSRVLPEHANAFLDKVSAAIVAHDTSGDRATGQHFILLPPEASNLVSAGVGRRTNNPADYIVREHRERCQAFLRRERATEAQNVAVVVYTAEAYLNDPDVDHAERALVAAAGSTHVLVAVLAPTSPVGPWTFVRNLAGANKAYKNMPADEIVREAGKVTEYYTEWCVVSD